ncbi:ArsR/SmtB family transcription factor [Rhodococcus pyridinivorans]|uniref:ArsR/SmtB family transcription factor n=1 Tax=Rhodococcus pyridinivorans TaxID=103816 RepID=UPI003463D381
MAMSGGPRTSALDGRATAVYAHLFQALADPTRLAVLQHLASGQHRVRDLVDHMGFAQSTVSKHLSFLHACRLIAMHPEGRSSWYSLADPAHLRSLIASAEDLLGAAGTHSQLCAHLRAPQDDPTHDKEND